MGFGGGLTKITQQSQIADALLGDPLMAQLGISTADLAVDARAYWARFLPQDKSFSGSSLSMVVNRAFICAISIPRKMTIDRLIVAVNGTNGNMLAGIYADNSDTPAGGSLVLSASSIPQALPTAFTVNKQLTQGLYWLAVMADNAVGNFSRCTSANQYGDPFDGCRYDAGGFALTDPCPAVTNDASASVGVAVRIKSFDA